MMPSDDLELELPSLDGNDDEESDDAAAHEDDAPGEDEEQDADALDDATGEDRPVDDLAFAEGSESGWLVDADGAAGLEIGGYDVEIADEAKVLGDDEPDHRGGGLEDLIDADETVVADGGEEGPVADDEDLREEDLPALDADDDGDVPDDMLFDRALVGGGAEDELRWADRAWERVLVPAGAVDELDDSGVLALPGDAKSARDQAWKKLDGGRITAAAFVPGGSVVVALGSGDKALLVRILPDGEARILAEVEAADARAVVTALRWDAGHGHLVAAGNFGVEAYRPA